MTTALILFAEGFEEIEAVTQVDILRRGGMDVTTVSIHPDKLVEGAHGLKVEADETLDTLTGEFDLLVVPGGMGGVNNLRASAIVLELVREIYQGGKWVTAICAGPLVLAAAGILKGKTATCYPTLEVELEGASHSEELVVTDGRLITSRGPATAMLFALQIVEEIMGSDKRRELEEDLLFHLL